MPLIISATMLASLLLSNPGDAAIVATKKLGVSRSDAHTIQQQHPLQELHPKHLCKHPKPLREQA